MSQSIRQSWSVLRALGPKEFVSRLGGYASLRFRGVEAYQKPLTKCIGSYAKECKTFIDIGAAEGDIVHAVAPLFDTVIAIEPAPHHQKVLKARKSKGLLGDAVLLNCAVGYENGTAKLGLSETNPDDNSLFLRKDLDKYVKVQQKTLDTIIAEQKIRPRVVIKMDVQGFEGYILKGAAKTLKAKPVIITEFWPWGLVQAGTDPQAMLNDLKQNGLIAKSLSGHTYSDKALSKIVRLGRGDKYVVADLLLTTEE